MSTANNLWITVNFNMEQVMNLFKVLNFNISNSSYQIEKLSSEKISRELSYFRQKDLLL